MEIANSAMPLASMTRTVNMVVSTLRRSGALPAIELRPLVASQRPSWVRAGIPASTTLLTARTLAWLV
jgi:hypothetical protein